MPVSGRTNGLAGDEQIVGPAGVELSPDPNGIDPEGLVVCSDGGFWISEEYRPSLLRCDANGTVVARHVPEGTALPGSDIDVLANLPRRYAKRRNNRGFEAIAISSDEATLWVSLQSPLEWPTEDAAETTGNIRMLVFDTRARKPISEYIYRLGNPNDPAYQATGVSSDDGKLCAMAMVGDEALLVLEQSDAGDARLYQCCWQQATNTLNDPRSLEVVGDLARHGVTCLEKTLVADLGPLLPAMAAAITDGQWRPRPDDPVAGLKLEGMVILDRQQIAICNDNDFDTDCFEDNNQPARRSCLWIISLDVPLGKASSLR